MKNPAALRLTLSFLVASSLLFFVIASRAARGSDIASSSLCTKDEKVVFSCQLRTAKVVSLCASSNLSRNDGYLQYRFGTQSKVELQYPTEGSNPTKAFTYSHYFRAQVDETEIGFSISGNAYTVFDSYNGEERPKISEQGVRVIPANKKEVTYLCKGKADADFSVISEVLVNEAP